MQTKTWHHFNNAWQTKRCFLHYHRVVHKSKRSGRITKFVRVQVSMNHSLNWLYTSLSTNMRIWTPRACITYIYPRFIWFLSYGMFCIPWTWFLWFHILPKTYILVLQRSWKYIYTYATTRVPLNTYTRAAYTVCVAILHCSCWRSALHTLSSLSSLMELHNYSIYYAWWWWGVSHENNRILWHT